MCLHEISYNLKKEVAKLKVESDGYIWLYKVFGLASDDELIGDYNSFVFYEGKNTASDGEIGYNPTYSAGFHCFAHKAATKLWHPRHYDSHIGLVKTRKSWITAVGKQYANGRRNKVVVCKHIII